MLDSNESIKAIFLLVQWRAIDFITGMSDLRDSFLQSNHTSLTTFISRVSSGTFFLAPFNLLCLLGLLSYWRSIISSRLYIPICGAIISISPSLLGVAMSRYWIMFYLIFFPVASSLILHISRASKSIDFGQVYE